MITYIYWWYLEEPVYLWKISMNIFVKTFYSFSIPLLLRTLFDPWKRDISSAENASMQDLFQLWISNLVSRFIGFIVRLITIFTGLLVSSLVLILELAVILAWFAMPVIVIYLLINGLRTIYA